MENYIVLMFVGVGLLLFVAGYIIGIFVTKKFEYDKDCKIRYLESKVADLEMERDRSDAFSIKIRAVMKMIAEQYYYCANGSLISIMRKHGTEDQFNLLIDLLKKEAELLEDKKFLHDLENEVYCLCCCEKLI